MAFPRNVFMKIRLNKPVCVKYIEGGPNSFWLQQLINLNGLKKLEDYMYKIYIRDRRFYKPKNGLFKGMMVCALYSNKYYRAVVLSDLGSGRFLVRYVDYGNVETVKLNKIWILPSELSSLPCQAVHCKLDNAPSVLSAAWSTNFCYLFNNEMTTATFISRLNGGFEYCNFPEWRVFLNIQLDVGTLISEFILSPIDAMDDSNEPTEKICAINIRSSTDKVEEWLTLRGTDIAVEDQKLKNLDFLKTASKKDTLLMKTEIVSPTSFVSLIVDPSDKNSILSDHSLLIKESFNADAVLPVDANIHGNDKNDNNVVTAIDVNPLVSSKASQNDYNERHEKLCMGDDTLSAANFLSSVEVRGHIYEDKAESIVLTSPMEVNNKISDKNLQAENNTFVPTDFIPDDLLHSEVKVYNKVEITDSNIIPIEESTSTLSTLEVNLIAGEPEVPGNLLSSMDQSGDDEFGKLPNQNVDDSFNVVSIPNYQPNFTDNVFEFNLAHFNSINDFYVIPTLFDASTYNEMERDLNDYYTNVINFEDRPNVAMKLQPGTAVAASRVDGIWARASIIAVHSDDGYIEVEFVDEGDRGILELHQVWNLDSNFATLPRRAINCKLAYLKPLHQKELEEASSKFVFLVGTDTTYLAYLFSQKLSCWSIAILANNMLVHEYIASDGSFTQDLEWDPMKFDFYSSSNTIFAQPENVGVVEKANDQEKLCKFFRFRGSCPKGDHCEFLHVSRQIEEASQMAYGERTIIEAFNELCLPSIGSTIVVQITQISSISHFHVIFVQEHEGDGANESLTSLYLDMNEFYEKSKFPNNTSPWTLGEIVAVRQENNDWLRGRIVSIPSYDDDSFEVFYVDYGNCDIVSSLAKNLRVIDDRFLHLPFQAVLCGIDGVKYTDAACVKESVEILKKFVEQSGENGLSAFISDIVFDEKLQIKILGPSGDDFGELLISKGLAKLTD